MSRTAVRYMHSLLAAIAFTAFVASHGSAGERGHFLGLDHTLTNKHARGSVIFDHSGLITQGMNSKTRNGLATQKQQQGTTTHYEWRWFQDYSGGK